MRADFRLGAGADELQRISACTLGTSAPAGLAHEAVLGMEASLLRQGWPVGKSLGALAEVREQIGLGRPAFREAITILEARGLLDVRRGPGGGLFVAVPTLEDVAGTVLMYLALTRRTHACIDEFRLLVWRMIVSAAIQRRVTLPAAAAPGAWGFAADLADKVGNTTMGMLARLSEMLARFSHSHEAPAGDRLLAAAVGQGDLAQALGRLDSLAGPIDGDAKIVALDVAERAFSFSRRKSAMALAAQMAQELGDHLEMHEAEWQTAERLGYTDAIVRQARRILQDFGIVRCRQGRKGVELAPLPAPTGIIRLLVPCFVANRASALDNREAIALLISNAPSLAASHVCASGAAPIAPIYSSAVADPLEALTFENLLVELSGNPLLVVVARSLGLANIFVGGDRVAPPDRGPVSALNRRILRAVEAGDVAAAGRLARAKLELMQRCVNGYRAVA